MGKNNDSSPGRERKAPVYTNTLLGKGSTHILIDETQHPYIKYKPANGLSFPKSFFF